MMPKATEQPGDCEGPVENHRESVQAAVISMHPAAYISCERKPRNMRTMG